MSSENEQPKQHDLNSPRDTVSNIVFAGESRRRFTKAGLAGAGVLMSLASRSALSAITVSPSAFASANASHHGPPSTTNARSPGYWKNHEPCGKNPVHPPDPAWPIPADTKFNAVFPDATGSLASMTFCEILNDSNATMYRDFATAYLNAASGGTPFLNPDPTLAAQVIKTMFHELATQGYYVPTGTIHWDTSQVLAYLEGTWQGL